jgi:hypothetical protein
MSNDKIAGIREDESVKFIRKHLPGRDERTIFG